MLWESFKVTASSRTAAGYLETNCQRRTRSVSGVLITTYSCWQQHYENWNLLPIAQWTFYARMLLFSVGNAAMNAPRYGNAAMNAPWYGNAAMNASRYGNGAWRLHAVGNCAKSVLRSLTASTITPCFPIHTARWISFPRWQFISECQQLYWVLRNL